MSLLSRTLIAAFTNIEETIVAIHNTKLMFTASQRRMTKAAMTAAQERATELCGYLGYDPDDVYEQENLDRVDLELARRAKARGVTIARREARVAKGHSRFVER